MTIFFCFCLTTLFCCRLLQVKPGPTVSQRTFEDCWCDTSYRRDTLPVTQSTVSSHYIITFITGKIIHCCQQAAFVFLCKCTSSLHIGISTSVVN